MITIKKIILTALSLVLITAGVAGSAKVFAEDSTNTNPVSSIVQKIADKFGLKKEDVQAVFDQNRQERRTQMEAKHTAQLDQDVKDGKITDAQKQLILNKQKELQTKRESERENMKNLTPEQRRTQTQTERQEVEDWAKQNNIDTKYLFGGMGKGFGIRGMGH